MQVGQRVGGRGSPCACQVSPGTLLYVCVCWGSRRKKTHAQQRATVFASTVALAWSRGGRGERGGRCKWAYKAGAIAGLASGKGQSQRTNTHTHTTTAMHSGEEHWTAETAEAAEAAEAGAEPVVVIASSTSSASQVLACAHIAHAQEHPVWCPQHPRELYSLAAGGPALVRRPVRAASHSLSSLQTVATTLPPSLARPLPASMILIHCGPSALSLHLPHGLSNMSTLRPFLHLGSAGAQNT